MTDGILILLHAANTAELVTWAQGREKVNTFFPVCLSGVNLHSVGGAEHPANAGPRPRKSANLDIDVRACCLFLCTLSNAVHIQIS